MSDTALATAPEPEVETPEDTAEVETFKLGDVVKRYFSPDQLQDEAQAAVSKIVAIAKTGEIKRNFDPEEPFPDGYGLAVIPLSKRNT